MKLLSVLLEDTFYEIRARQALDGIEGISKRKAYSIKRDEFIQEVQMEFINGEITAGHCL